MYLKSLAIDGIRSIESLRMDFESGKEPGWHVVVGPNGSGKSTIIRAIALAMLDESDVKQLPRDIPSSFLRYGLKSGRIAVETVSASGRTAQRSSWRWEFKSRGNAVNASLKLGAKTKSLPWSRRSVFTAAFGPYRRMSGEHSLLDSLARSSRRLGAHLSALSEAVSLSASQSWLYEIYSEEQNLDRTARSTLKQFLSSNEVSTIVDAMIRSPADRTAGAQTTQTKKLGNAFAKCFDEVLETHQMRHGTIVLKAVAIKLGKKIEETEFDFELDSLSRKIMRFLNRSGFLFDSVKITEPRQDRILVRDFTGAPLSLEDLSDGYRTVISLVLETMRQMLQASGPKVFMEFLDSESPSIDIPGVVAIDEIEAHLHPTWQASIGAWLQYCFPRIQFIVTTHSPIVCRAVALQSEIRGSLWKLPDRNSPEKFERVAGAELQRVVYGDLVEALGTNVFGHNVEQSRAASKMLDRLAELNLKSTRSSLSAAEKKEQQDLRRTFPARPSLLPE